MSPGFHLHAVTQLQILLILKFDKFEFRQIFAPTINYILIITFTMVKFFGKLKCLI